MTKFLCGTWSKALTKSRKKWYGLILYYLNIEQNYQLLQSAGFHSNRLSLNPCYFHMYRERYLDLDVQKCLNTQCVQEFCNRNGTWSFEWFEQICDTCSINEIGSMTGILCSFNDGKYEVSSVAKTDEKWQFNTFALSRLSV